MNAILTFTWYSVISPFSPTFAELWMTSTPVMPRIVFDASATEQLLETLPVKSHNYQVKQEGGVRLLTYLLPIKSPWLNPQEPHWVHCKRNVVEPKAMRWTPSVGQEEG